MKSHDEIKTWITTELAKVLQNDPESIDPDQQFSSFGVDSLVAFSLTGDLSEWIGEELSATLLWEYPTINSLSREISNMLSKESAEKKPGSGAILLASNENVVSSRLFCICGIDLYQALANQLVNKVETYGVYIAPEKSLGKISGDITHSYDFHSVEDLARQYIDEIISIQREGPYHLLGLSFGGVLAFELAQQLTRRGADVPLVVLLDSVLPNAITVKTHKKIFLALKGGFSKLGSQKTRQSDSTSVLTPEMMGKLRGKYYWELVKRYQPRPYSNPTVLIRATRSKLFGEGYIVDENLGWAELVKDKLTVVRIAGTHTGILEKPHVNELAEFVRSKIVKE